MDSIADLLRTSRTIAVVGLSPSQDRPSYRVARYLHAKGYRVLPVNPNIQSWKGMQAYPSLDDIEEPVDIVNVFRRPQHVPDLVEQAIRIGARAIWLQLGIHHDEPARRGEEAGLIVVQDRCISVEHSKRQPEIGEEGAW
jgi:uncharacterized protein